MKHRNRKSKGCGNPKIATNAPELAYAKGKTMEWLMRATELGLPLDRSFFDCLEWCLHDLSQLLHKIIEEVQGMPKESVTFTARQSLFRVSKGSENLSYEFRDILGKHSCLYNPFLKTLKKECAVANKRGEAGSKIYRKIMRQLERVFGLDHECLLVCEFIFLSQSFSPISAYFEDELEVHTYGGWRHLAYMLGVPFSALQAHLRELSSSGMLDPDSDLRLNARLSSFWETADTSRMETVFCRPLTGETLPLENFHISQEEIAHVQTLLKKTDNVPVHILLYGIPGTGKTTFVRSLARACGVKVWSALSRDDDYDADRRLSLAACLRITAKHKGSFVLVDEAERLLDSILVDKAWLNDFLEQPGRRVIWIVNQLEDIDQAVRRRFTFSIHFGELGLRERLNIWQQIATKYRVKSRLSETDLKNLTQTCQAPTAVIDSAVFHAKRLCASKDGFCDTVRRTLDAYMTLHRDGNKSLANSYVAADFNLDGVCIKDSAHDLLSKCRRVDVLMRESTPLRPGCATMLFYGPPGTGKTALGRYIAKEMNRECIVKRASDLLSPWVGEAEQQVAEAFKTAEARSAVLIIDEVDTFLYSRDAAHRSWEISMVNEFLTALEECRCFCICTTNRQKHLDAAAMRRFSYKVEFGYATAEQVRALYASLLAPLCATRLPLDLEEKLLNMQALTPGDFHVVRSQYYSPFEEVGRIDHKTLIAALSKEQDLKNDQRRVGFCG